MLNKALFSNGSWLLCRPVDYDIRYQINPWMDVTRGAHQGRAQEQWRTLHHTLLRCGAWVEYINQGTNVPDMVFTANGGLVKGQKVVLPKFRHKERQPEETLFEKWFRESNFEVLTVSTGAFEGEGDALFSGETLFAGYGFRSDLKVYDEIRDLLSVKKVVPVEMVDGRFYHLDTCFAPLGPNLVMLYPPALSADSLARVEKEAEVIKVEDQDAVRFVCNSVVLDKVVIMPNGCVHTAKKLEERGYAVHFVEMDEFIKAGGASKCLSLRLQN